MKGTPRERGVLTPAKIDPQAVTAAWQLKADISRYVLSSRAAAIWFSLTVFFLFEIFLLQGAILNFWLWLLMGLDEWSVVTASIEFTLLVVCALNALACLIVCFGTKFSTARAKLNLLNAQQKKLLGLDERSLSLSEDQSEMLVKSPLTDEKSRRRESFAVRLLSALQFGSAPTSSNIQLSPTSYNNHADFDASFQRSGLITSTPHGSPYYDRSYQDSEGQQASFVSASATENSIPLAAKVGSRHSSFRKSSSSIQTKKQLDSFLTESSLLDASTVSSPPAFGSPWAFSGSPNTSYGALNRSAAAYFSVFEGASSVYELGTSFSEDERAKGTVPVPEDGVVNLVFGSRVKATPSRVSLSPIPLNLVNAELGAPGDVANGKSTSNGAADVPRNAADEDSVSFRIAHNLPKESPKKSSAGSASVRRSSSAERRRSSSMSPRPRGTRRGSPYALRGSSPDEPIVSGTKTAYASQIPITSSEILSKYKMDAVRFAVAERKFRQWICEAIVRPIVANINKMNDIFAKEHAQSHLKIGRSSLATLQLALSSKSDLLTSPLPYLLAYLRVHDNQAYLVRRAKALSADVCMTAYNWQAGGDEPLDKQSDGSRAFTPQDGPWGEHLPTDAHLIWSWFCAYLDSVIPANSLVSDIHAPFSSLFFLKKPNKPSFLQCAKEAFYVHQLSANPPYFELVVKGGRERFEVGRGARNLWRTVLLFLQHARLFNNDRISGIALDEGGLNIARVLH